MKALPSESRCKALSSYSLFVECCTGGLVKLQVRVDSAVPKNGWKQAQSTETFEGLRNPPFANSHVVRKFLREVDISLRRQISLLPRLTKDSLPDILLSKQSFDEYGEWPSSDPILRPVLTAISQFVEFFGYLDVKCDDIDLSKHYMLGLCTGLLPAAAFTACNTCISDLVPLAVEVVCITFRMGVHTSSVANSLRYTSSLKETWSSVIQGKFAPDTLTTFHKDTNISPWHQAYISAITPNSTTVSGPPHTLRRFFDSETFHATGCSHVSIPIYAPYHANHLYQATGTDWILGAHDPSTSEILGRYRCRSVLISTKTGKPFLPSDMTSLLRQVVDEILNDVLRWDILLDEVDILAVSKCQVTVIGSLGGFGKSMVSRLQANGKAEVSLISTAEELKGVAASRSTEQTPDKRSKIAIVGMSGRFPGAKDTEELWNLLGQGLELHKEIPKDRFDVDTHVDPSGKKKNTILTPYGCFIDQPGLFDASFFRISPREAATTDPMQRLSLVTAHEALEMSGYVPNRTPSSMLDRVGTFYGQTIDDYREVNASQNIDAFYVTGGLRPFGPVSTSSSVEEILIDFFTDFKEGRIHYHYKFTGPSYIIDTACSSSLAAIHIACNSLWNGDCDTAIAGGTNIITGSDMYAGLSRGHFLSTTGSCKTFDNTADGYCRGEAVGTVILKRLEDAVADNDLVLGVILGSATNHSSQASSITQPHGPTQELLYKKILNQTGVNPLNVNYFELHGTGTQIGDSTEMQSVSNIFAPTNGRKINNPLYIGSIKANLGHSEAAAGVTAVIKALLMFEKQAIPPHIGIKTEINHKFPSLNERQIQIPLQSKSFREEEARKRLIFINNFGAAGGNTALLLEGPPIRTPATSPFHQPTHVITVSAKTRASLKMNKQRLYSFLESNPETSLADLSYTTTSRRAHFDHRFVAVVPNMSDLLEALMEELDEAPLSENAKIVLAFTGQGCIYTGLGKELFEVSDQFRSDILQFDNLAKALGLSSFMPLLDPKVDIKSLSTVQTHLGQVCIQIALYRLYRSWGIVPDTIIGHSLGEYAALYACGVLTAADAILLVGRRAEIMDQYCTPGTYAMLAVKGDLKHIDDIVCKTNTEIACINGPNDVVLSGPMDKIISAASLLSDVGVQSTRLGIPYACHSSQLDPAVQPFEKVAEGVQFYPAKTPLLSPLLGKEISHGETIDAKYLSRHLREPVDFVAALKSSKLISINQNVQFLELGPHPICMGMIRNILGKSTIPSMRKGQHSWTVIAQSLSALYMGDSDIDWLEYNREFASSARMLNLPTYAFDEQNHWIEYKNDWALSKGRADLPPPDLQKDKGPATSSIQHLIRENIHAPSATAEFESDIWHPALYDAISGHVINGVGLCQSSVYADMAFTVAKYLHERVTPDFVDLGMDVMQMEILAPVILDFSKERKSQLIRISTTLNEGKVSVQFSDAAATGSSSIVYAECIVVLRNPVELLRQWSRSKHLVCSRIDHIRAMKGINKLNRQMAYKLFRAVVEYSEGFHGMDEVLLHSEQHEAVAQVSFKTEEHVGNFFRSPYWIDSLTQLSGFVMNGNETIDAKKAVYISNGWESMHFAAQLSSHKTYTVYVKMQPSQGSIYSGDLYVLDAEEIVGVSLGIRFQLVHRELLKLLLAPPPSSKRSVKSKLLDPCDLPEPSSSSKSSTEPKNTPASSLSAQLSYKDSHDEAESSRGAKFRQLVKSALGILCEQLSLESQKLGGKVKFADVGVDSLMSLTILGHFRESLDLELPPTTFQTCHTVEGLVKVLEGIYGESADFKSMKSATTTTSSQISSDNAANHHQATSVMLQGNKKTAVANLFLFPGGFGTASTFASLPQIAQNVAVFGLNSAFVNAPGDFTVSISEMASLYVAEVRRRQPLGPYSFLGYSVGGIIAYEAALQLILVGEAVERLYLVDSPCPLVIPPMPLKLLDFLDSIDRFTGKNQGEHASSEEAPKPMGSLHVTQTLMSLESYVPKPLPDKCLPPRTTYYIAKRGVNNQATVKRPAVSERDQKVMTWLLDDRSPAFGNGGWDMLIGTDSLHAIFVEGNHFNIMKEPHVSTLYNTIE
ncbi:unnamed protein product, partial [Sphagnum balticum]